MKHSTLVSLVLLCMTLVGLPTAAQITGWDEVGPTISGQKYGFSDSNIKTESVTAVKKGNRWGFVTSDNKTKIKPKYDAIGDTVCFLGESTFTDQPLPQSGILVKEKGKWGLVGYNGKVLIKPEYDSLGDFYSVKYHSYGDHYGYEGRSLAKAGDKQIIVNTKGKKLATIGSDVTGIRAFGPTIIGIKQNGEPIAIETAGKYLKSDNDGDLIYIFYTSRPIGEREYEYYRNSLEGEIFYNPKTKEYYELADHNMNGSNARSKYCVIKNNEGLLGVITKPGTLYAEPKYNKIQETDEGKLIILYKPDETTDLLIDGKFLALDKTAIAHYHGFILFTNPGNDNLLGVMKTDGTIVSEPKYSAYKQVYDGKYNTYIFLEDGPSFVAFLTGDKLVELPAPISQVTPTEHTTELTLTSENNGIAVIDAVTGELKQPFGKYSKTILLDNGCYYVRSMDNKWGLANHDLTKEIIPTKYDDVNYLGNQHSSFVHYKVTNNGKHGVVNSDGKLVVPIGKYKDFYTVDLGYIVTKNGNKYGLVDFNGKQIVPSSYDAVLAKGNGNIAVANNAPNGGTIYIYSQSGKLLKQAKFTNSEKYRLTKFLKDWLGSWPQQFFE